MNIRPAGLGRLTPSAVLETAAPDLPFQNQHPCRFALAVLDDASSFMLEACREVIRRANRELGHERFDVKVVDPTSDDYKFSSKADALILLAGKPVSQSEAQTLGPVIRDAQRNGRTVVALGGAVFVLGFSGLLEGREFCVDQEFSSHFEEQFPWLSGLSKLFLHDRNIVTGAGGVAAIDMMFWLISSQLAPQHLSAAASGLQIRSLRNWNDEQVATSSGYGTIECPKVREAIQLFEDNIEQNISAEEVASAISVSRRHLERLFQTHLGESPCRFFKRIRLRHARNLILDSTFSITDIALMTGFTSLPHFINCYKATYGQSPTKELPRSA